ncbi:uncharacterized protein [Nicotiana tomentosiformis]|uniref:uncharacterized protein n=1 Tax=Nicotiana tomentosiformis TaxID=4098 RepID=UPI00388C43B5
MPRWFDSLNHLVYADDTIIFASAHPPSLSKIMAVLGNYEKISGQMINKDKSSYYMYSKVANGLFQAVGAITGFARGKFSVSSAWHILRHRADPNQEFKLMWIKGLPFKISFFLWRMWRQKIATDDMWRRQGQMIIRHWRYAQCCPKLKPLFQAVSAIITWELWKRRNADMIQYFEGYKPILITTRVTWKLPCHGWYKCNTDGASKGNLRPSSLGFYVRDDEVDVAYARAVDLGVTTNVVAEAKAILQGLEYCVEHDFHPLILKTDSLVMKKAIEGEWDPLWVLVGKDLSLQDHKKAHSQRLAFALQSLLKARSFLAFAL